MVKFLPNTRSEYLQPDPVITTLTDGRYVVVWQSLYQDGQDAGIIARLYNSNGQPLGGEFLVNTTTKDFQDTPAVSALADGGFVVTWQSRDYGGTEYDIFAQRYSTSGKAVGNEFRVSSYLTGFQTKSAVTALNNGGFVVTWQSEGQDGSEEGVYAQRYDSNSIRIGGEFKVNTITSNFQNDPSITTLNDGSFVITWESDGQDGNRYGIYGQRYDSNGTTLGGQFLLNNQTIGSQNRPAITALSNGGFVATWNSDSQNGSEYEIFARIFNSSANPVGNEFQVNSFSSDNQIKPAVTDLSDGGFVITWRSLGQNANDFGVYGQKYNTSGQKVGNEFQVNSFATGDQGYSAVTGLNNGGFVVTWHSLDPQGKDYGLYSQNFNSNGDKIGSVVKVNTFTPTINPLDTTIPPGDNLTIVIAASNSSSVDAANATLQANGINDQDLINTAIAQIHAAGKGQVILLSGTYNISDNILLRSNVKLTGSGLTTKLRLDDNTNLSLSGIIRTQGASDRSSDVAIYNSGVSNLQIDGNRANQTSKSKQYGIYGTYDGAVFENLYVHDTASYGFDPHEDSRNGRATSNIVIRNNIVENAGLDGITLDRVINSFVENNLTINNDRHGINAVSRSENTLIKNNYSIGNDGNGITVQAGSRLLDITGNEIANNLGNGIYLPGEGGNTIDRNKIFSSGKYGIGVKSSSGNKITDNLVMDSSQLTNDLYSEIELYDDDIIYSTNNTVTGNITRSSLTNRSRYGIREKSSGDNYNIITDNVVSPSLRGDYFIKGTNTTFARSTITVLTGDAGSNVINGGSQSERLIGLGGNDTINGGSGKDLLEGNAGDDSLVGGDSNDVLWGNEGGDRLQGNSGDDYLNGDLGNDVLYGNDGGDILDGSLGNDTLFGGSGNNSLYGRQGFDSLVGGVDSDRLWGGEDNDTLIADLGNDYLNGGLGDDRLVGDGGDDFLDGDAGNDNLNGGAGNDLLKGNSGNDILQGGLGNDYLTGGTGNDTLSGNEDNDLLEGDAGDDFLYGNSGNDILTGGSGIDILVGGSGNDAIDLGNDTESDTFLYTFGDGSDVIQNFDLGEDRFAIIDVANVRVSVNGSNTEFRTADSNNLLVTFEGTIGFNSNNLADSLSVQNTANFIFG
jgi:parallel beta-helix repeat protein